MTMNAAARVFNIPELMELILLSLPSDTSHQEIDSTRTIRLSRTACRTWHDLIASSTALRRRLYLGSPTDAAEAQAWMEKTSFPPARPNPWIPHILLNQRSWGSAYPFDGAFSAHTATAAAGDRPSPPRNWTFSFEMSRAQYSRLPEPGPWRDMLAASPPFTDFWCTRSFYELGSGRAPFVTHLDYDAKLPKSAQKYRTHCASGVTLGAMVDAVGVLFEEYAAAKFVMVESVRHSCMCLGDGGVGRELIGLDDLADDRPMTRAYMPGSSAERELGW